MLLLLLAAGCNDGTDDARVVSALTSGATSATVALSNDWGSGYCANVTVSNAGATATSSWNVTISLNQSALANIWSANQTTSGSTMTATPMPYDATINPGASVSFGFCSNATGATYRPTVTAVSATGNGGGSTSGVGGSRATGGSNGSAGKLGTGGAVSTGGTVGSGGRVATGGTVGSGGQVATGGSTGSGGSAASQCTFPASGWGPFNGNASFTWYYFGQGTGQDNLGYRTACGYTGHEPSGQDSDTVQNIAFPAYFAAIPGASGSSFETVNHCGACAQLTNGGKSIIATIVDECPLDSNPACASTGHLDLSRAAFNALGYGVGNPGGTTWKYVPCPVTGGVVVRGKSGNADQVYIENVVLPIQAVTVNGQAARHLSYGAWQLPVNAAVGLTLTLTDSSGRMTNVRIADTNPGDSTSTGTQEPLCR
ncbi:MAG TPA: cellulose binding domain-containing protein [Polyangia bacterium]|nr:cellulose binding domain-containing protein [Polyangia bacterium]